MADDDDCGRSRRSRGSDTPPKAWSGGVAASLPAVMSPRELAKFLGVSKDKVLGWIHAGQLHAIDVRSSDSSRPQYRIPGDAIQAFSAARSSSTRRNMPETKGHGRNPSRPPPKIEYF